MHAHFRHRVLSCTPRVEASQLVMAVGGSREGRACQTPPEQSWTRRSCRLNGLSSRLMTNPARLLLVAVCLPVSEQVRCKVLKSLSTTFPRERCVRWQTLKGCLTTRPALPTHRTSAREEYRQLLATSRRCTTAHTNLFFRRCGTSCRPKKGGSRTIRWHLLRQGMLQ